MPLAILARVLAVAGATTMMSACWLSSMWVIRDSGVSSLISSSRTGWAESVSKVMGPTNRVAALSHDHAHVHAGLLQAAQQLGGFVSGDTPRYPKEYDGLVGHEALLAAKTTG